jgi:hypothetical protein
MTASTTEKPKTTDPAKATVDWSSVSLTPVEATSVQPAKKKQATDIPEVIRSLVDGLKAAPGRIVAVAFPSEAHAKQARTLINQYARMTGVDPSPNTYLQPDGKTLHVRIVKKAAAEAAK